MAMESGGNFRGANIIARLIYSFFFKEGDEKTRAAPEARGGPPRTVGFTVTLILLVSALLVAVSAVPVLVQYASTIVVANEAAIASEFGRKPTPASRDDLFARLIEATRPDAIIGLMENDDLNVAGHPLEPGTGNSIIETIKEHKLTWPSGDQMLRERVRIADVRCCGQLANVPFYVLVADVRRYRFIDRPKLLSRLDDAPSWTLSLIPRAHAEEPRRLPLPLLPGATVQPELKLPPELKGLPPVDVGQKQIQVPAPPASIAVDPGSVTKDPRAGQRSVAPESAEPAPSTNGTGDGGGSVAGAVQRPVAPSANGTDVGGTGSVADGAVLPDGARAYLLFDRQDILPALIRTSLYRVFADGHRSVLLLDPKTDVLNQHFTKDRLSAHDVLYESIRRFGIPRSITVPLSHDVSPGATVRDILVSIDSPSLFALPLAVPPGGFGEPKGLPDDGVSPADAFNAAAFANNGWSAAPGGALFGGFMIAWFLAAGFTARRRDGASTAAQVVQEIFRQQAPSLMRLLATAAISVPMIAAVWWFMGQIWWRWPASDMATVPGLIGLAGLFAVALGFVQYRIVMSRRALSVLEDVLERFRTAFFRDVPLTHVSDDRLNHAKIAHSLARFLSDRDTRPPLVVAINGPWGGGKSSVMGMLDSELRESGGFRSIWFNAWRYDKEEHILAALLQTMAASLRRDVGPRFWVGIAWSRFLDGTLADRVVLLTAFAALMALVFAPDSLVHLAHLADTVAERGWVSFLTASDEDDVRVTMAGLGGLGAGTAAAAWIWGFVRLLTPFRLPFKKLAKLENYGDRVGFIGEFAREFQRYRDAIGRKRKFVVFIDDLDRCPPDKVVEVLKTINLVINSGVGAERTIFVLGFDRAYVRDCVQHHFREFLETAHSADTSEDFGNRYLKKMVTLSVSVPLPTRDQIFNMLSERERAAGASDVPVFGRRGTAFTLVPAGRFLKRYMRPLWPLPVIFAAIWFGLPRAKPGKEATVTGEGGVAETAVAVSSTTNVQVTETVYPLLILPPDVTAGWLAWSFLAAAVLALVGVHWAALSDNSQEQPKAKDYKGPFIDHLQRWAALLPDNPRDAVRLINALRVGNEIEMQDTRRTLGEADMTLLMLLAFKNPDLFDPACTDGGVLEKLHAARSNGRQESDAVRDLLAAEFPGTDDFDPMTIQIFGDVSKVARFMELHRYCLDTANGNAG